MMTDYEYSPLNLIRASEIRLLTLLPGPKEAEIHINLEVVLLEEPRIPQFEALSYTWGSTESPINIFIDEEKRTSSIRRPQKKASRLGATCVNPRTLAVTQNLATALRYLRYDDRPRVLWIDAICVDQKNFSERSQQVARMADIYSLANRVVVWLGPESHDSALALRSLSTLGSRMKVDWDQQTYAVVPAVEDPQNNSIDHLLMSHFDGSIWTSLFSLLKRPWFGRLWIWQEVHLAKNEVQILCGYDDIAWRTFGNAIHYLYFKESKPAILQDPRGFWEYMERAYLLCSFRPMWGLFDALCETRRSECSDEKDKIYAILNLVDKHLRENLEPDYSKSTSRAYQDVVLDYLRICKSLNLLRFCELREPIADKPTWVPDWSSPNAFELVTDSCISWGSEAHGEYVGNGVLRVTGIWAAKIDHTENIFSLPENPNVQEVVETVKNIATSIIKSDEYVGGGTMADAVCRTLCYDISSDRYLPAKTTYPDCSQCRNLLLDIVKVKDGYIKVLELSTESEKYLSYVSRAMRGRSFLVTKDGYIGLAPQAVEPGDQICIVFGCNAPLILRPDEIGRRSVVGECYIHGRMDGATLLGPLPSMWQNVYRYDAASREYWGGFINHETGESQIEDPRLGPLPTEWRTYSHKEEGAYNIYINDRTRKRTLYDPRQSLEALRARGVELQDFWLK